MRHHRFLALCLAALLCGVGQAIAIEFNPDTMMRLADVRAGMTGACRTVLQGTTIEEFPVEIVGVLEKQWSGGSIILFRITSGPLVEKKLGILSGMSGSPIYINGKLIGAVSLSFDIMMQEPMGGATPIEQMLEPTASAAPPEKTTVIRSARPIEIAGRRVRDFVLARPGAPVSSTLKKPVLRPVLTPLFVSGLPPDALASLRPRVEAFGFRVYPGPGQSSTPVEAPLEPGSAVGVAFCMGDVSAAGVGTVTYREGDEIIAFGHPMMGTGECSLPLTAAWVHGYVQSSFDPFKLASPAQVVGTLTGDWAFSVGGKIGSRPRTIPVKISTANLETGATKNFSVEVCQDKMLSELGLMIALDEALASVGRQMGPSTWLGKITLTAEGLKPITRRVASSSMYGGAGYEVSYEVMQILWLLGGNPWKTADVLSLEVETQWVDQERTATIMRAETDRLTYRPGENVNVSVVVQPMNGKRYVERLSLPLPKELPDGSGTVVVTGGGSEYYGMGGDGMGGYGMGGDGLLPPALDDLPGFMDWYQTLDAGNDLVAVIAYPTTGVTFPEGQLKDLPQNVFNLLGRSGRQDQMPGMQWDKSVQPSEYVLWGGDAVEFTVERERWGAPGEKAGEHAPAKAHHGPPAGAPAEAGPPVEELSRLSVRRPAGVQAWLPPTPVNPYLPFARASATPAGPAAPGGVLLPRQDKLPPEVRRELERRGLLGKGEMKEEAPPKEAPGGEEGKEEEKEKEKPEPVTRQALLQGWTTGEDFSRFRFSGAAPTPDGSITLLPAAAPEQVAEIPETMIWCAAAADDGTVYVGTGHKGRVYKVTASGQVELLLETGELEVTALALSTDGTLYVGTGPEGRLYKVGTEGKSELVFDAPERYVWALLPRPDGSVLMAVGGPAACVYRIVVGSAPTEFLRPPDCRHALVLAAEGDAVLVGTGEEGRVYRCPPDSAPRIIFDTKAHDSASDVVGILPTRDGVIVGTADGELRAIKPSGVVVDISTPDESEDLSLGVLLPPGPSEDPKGPLALIATTESDAAVYVLFSLETTPALVKRFPGHQFTAAGRSSSGQAFVCSSNPCAVFALPLATPEHVGQAVSPPFDMERVSQLGRLFWRANLPEGTHVWVESRSGNTPEPDDTWSAWSSGHVLATGEQLTSPAARYVQSRVNLRGSADGKAPWLDELYFIYMPTNRPPTVSFSEPSVVAFWAGENEISWEGEDPDKDALTYDLFVSCDNGVTWESLKEGLSETTYSWDTKEKKDGAYRLKVVASDARANGAGAQTKEALSCPVFVDNTPPHLTKRQIKHELDQEKRLHVTGSTIDRQSDIAGVEYCIDDGEPISANADDGIFDSIYERFSLVTEPLEPGTHAVKITAYDEARNTSSYTIEKVEVPGAEEETGEEAKAPAGDQGASESAETPAESGNGNIEE